MTDTTQTHTDEPRNDSEPTWLTNPGGSIAREDVLDRRY